MAFHFRLVLISCTFLAILQCTTTKSLETGLDAHINNSTTELNNSRSVGYGETVYRLTDFPHQVSIKYNNKHICSGTILNEKYVLTACSCVYTKHKDAYKVAAGSVSLLKQNVVRNVSDIIIHPNCKRDTLENDLAIIRVDENFILNSTVASLPLSSTLVPAHEIGTSLGWANIFYEGKLQRFKETTMDLRKCNSTTGGHLKRQKFCTSRTVNHGLCDEDVGGPFIYNHQLAGIISETPCNNYFPTIYTNISSHYDWITDTSGSAYFLPLTINLILSLLCIYASF